MCKTATHKKMSDEAIELDEIDFNSELESAETISNVSFSPSRVQENLANDLETTDSANIVKNLFRREIGYGSLKPTGQTLLRSYNLTSIFPSQILLSHVFMGMTKCGRFLITYTVSADQDDDEWYATVYKYRLHWWSFKPGSQVRKIAEVSLFGNHKIVAPVQMYICQWPQDFEKILVYGLIKECSGIDVSAPTNNQHVFVTVTALPSINNCQDCRVVASSYMLDDIAASWDTCLRFSCLKHGYTVHTSFDVVVPYPEFLPKISLKCHDYAVFNANNFLFAIRISLSNCEKKTKDVVDHEDLPYELMSENCEETKVIEEPSFSVNTQTQENEGERPLKLKEQIIRDFSEEVTLNPLGGARKSSTTNEQNAEIPARFTGDEDTIHCRRTDCLTSPPLPTRVGHFRVGDGESNKLHGPCGEEDPDCKDLKNKEESDNDNFRHPKSSNFMKRSKSEIRKTSNFEAYKSEKDCSKKCYKSFFTRHKVARNNLNFGMFIRSNGFAKTVLKSVKETEIHSSLEGRHRLRCSDADSTYEFVDDAQHEVEKLSQFRKKRLADKKYEFQDFDSENIIPFSIVRQENTLRSPRKSAELDGDLDRRVSLNLELRFGGETVSGTEKTEMILRSPSPRYSLDLSISVPSPRSPLILEILSSPTQHEGVLRPFNRNTNGNQMLSPIAKYLASPPNAQKFARQQSKDYSKSKGCDDSKNATKQGANKFSTNLDTRFILENDILINDLSEIYFKDGIGNQFDTDVYQNLFKNASKFQGESIRFERRFVEVDDELVSVITDIEDDDMSAVTGYHTALNMEVHGAGYSQLQMISNSKAEKLSAPCVVIDQQSLDIEGICHSVATTLCHVSNKTFTFCNDYDIEILDVCPHTGDVLVLLMMRIEGSEGIREEVSQLEQYEASVTLVWNLHSGSYKVRMVVPPQKVSWVWDSKAIWNPAREASKRFRMQLPADVTLCDPAVKVSTNSSTIRGISLSRILDMENCVQFVL